MAVSHMMAPNFIFTFQRHDLQIQGQIRSKIQHGGWQPSWIHKMAIISQPVCRLTWCFVLGWGPRLSLDLSPSGLHTRTAVARNSCVSWAFLFLKRHSRISVYDTARFSTACIHPWGLSGGITAEGGQIVAHVTLRLKRGGEATKTKAGMIGWPDDWSNDRKGGRSFGRLR